MGVFARGSKLWIRYRDVDGAWRNVPTGHLVGEERQAEAKYEALLAHVCAASPSLEPGRAAAAVLAPVTVRAWADRWIEQRRQLGKDWKEEKARLEHHVLPSIGNMPITELRMRHIIELAMRWRTQPLERTGEPMAPHTIRNVNGVMNLLLADAEEQGIIEHRPKPLSERHLGPKRDKDPEWRSGAVLTRDEVQTLISSAKIPWDRRVEYAVELLAGVRTGEAAALRWRHYDATMKPLGKLTVALSYCSKRKETKGTKTEAVKHVPVHPVLAAMLAEWKIGGWERMMGRAPGPDDLILPLPPEDAAKRKAGAPIDAFRPYWYSGRRWRDDDLPALNWRHRRHYDTRATFITLALEDGARRDIIRDRVTHVKSTRSAFDGYDRGAHWTETCGEITKLQIVRADEDLVTAAVTVAANDGDSSSLLAPKEGFEGEADCTPRDSARATSRLHLVTETPSAAEHSEPAPDRNGSLQADAVLEALDHAREGWAAGGDRRRLRRDLLKLLAELEDA